MSTSEMLGGLARRCAELAFVQREADLRGETFRFAAAALLLDPRQRSARGLWSLLAQSLIGNRIWTLGRRLRGRGASPTDAAGGEGQRLRAAAAQSPADAALQSRLGELYERQGQPVEAYACWRTARTLAMLQGHETQIPDSKARALAARFGGVPPSSEMAAEYDPFGRYRLVVARVLSDLGSNPRLVVDVGGGNGFLAALLPDADYLLAEPSVNGIEGAHLPLETGAADAVVALHMLEHVPPLQRSSVLDELIRVARRGIWLLGPFAPPPGQPFAEDAIVAATGAEWAREHLALGLPRVEELQGYFEARGLSCAVEPNADARVMYWQFLAHQFALWAGMERAQAEAARFFQQHFTYAAGGAPAHDYLLTVRRAE